MKNVFIIGSKGIPAKYGGFETFVEKLTEKRKDENIKYHVACLSDNSNEFYHNNARCFNIKVPNVGAAKAVYYDVLALKEVIKYIKENDINDAIIYILACRIGPFMPYYKKQIYKLGAKLYINPDGHEWKRGKWNAFIKRYWKISERLMVKSSDLMICDSMAIEKYIKEDYKKYNPNTTFIAYGADIKKSTLSDNDKKLMEWYKEKQVKMKEYYLVVGRFVPENNYEIMIKEFMKSDSKKDFVIITNIEKNNYYNQLRDKTEFFKDKRIKFVGTVYDEQLLNKIRENAYAYFHGHEVGGTNPSLLEALATTDLNILLDVEFNKEVAMDGAVYFNKNEGSLTNIINKEFSKEEVKKLSDKAKSRICKEYSWNIIRDRYEQLFTS